MQRPSQQAAAEVAAGGGASAALPGQVAVCGGGELLLLLLLHRLPQIRLLRSHISWEKQRGPSHSDSIMSTPYAYNADALPVTLGVPQGALAFLSGTSDRGEPFRAICKGAPKLM